MSATVKITICSGTTCYVMGGAELLSLGDHLPAAWQGSVQIEGAACLGNCRDGKPGKAPYVLIDGELVSSATVPVIMRKIADRLGEP